VLEGIGTGWTAFPGHTAADYLRAIRDASVEPDGDAHWSSIHNLDVYRRQLGAKARHLWHTLRPGEVEWR
jgi:hypothetical protein